MTEKKIGPDGKYTEWLTPEGILLVQGWKRDGLTNLQIAANMGVTETTLYNWRDRSPEFKQALKVGKDEANFQVENALFRMAKSGNVNAMIYYLNNNWRDKYYASAPKPAPQAPENGAEKILTTFLDKLVGEVRGE